MILDWMDHRMSYDLTEYAEKLRELYENTFEKNIGKGGRNQTCLSENRIGICKSAFSSENGNAVSF